MMTILAQVLLLVAIIVELALSIYMLVSTHKQYKRDKAFYEQLSKNLEMEQAVFLTKLEEGAQCEQLKETGDKK